MTRRELIAGMAAAAATFAVRTGDTMPELEKIRILFIAGFGSILALANTANLRDFGIRMANVTVLRDFVRSSRQSL
jgi:hypothetical protein